MLRDILEPQLQNVEGCLGTPRSHAYDTRRIEALEVCTWRKMMKDGNEVETRN